MVPGDRRLSREGQALASSFLKPNWTDEWEDERTHSNPVGSPDVLFHFLENRG